MKKKAMFVAVFIVLSAVTVPMTIAENTRGKPKAVAAVAFDDGSTVKLSELAIYGTPRSPAAYIRRGTQELKVPGIPVRKGRFWKQVSLDDLQSVSFINTEGKVELADGRVISGFIPASPARQTWMGGDIFMFKGKRTVLGREGVFSIARSDVSKISRSPDKPTTYEIVDTEGEARVITDMKLVRRMPAGGVFRPRIRFPDSHVDFVVDETSVRISLANIATLSFPEQNRGPVGIRLKSGEEAIGNIEDFSRWDYVFGETVDGDLLFTPMRSVKEIQFL